MVLAKGKIFLRCVAHALLVGLKEIPGVGMAVELGRGWFDIFRDEQRPQDARILLEMLRPDRLQKPVRSELNSHSQRPVSSLYIKNDMK